jgi:hypothetical protein
VRKIFIFSYFISANKLVIALSWIFFFCVSGEAGAFLGSQKHHHSHTSRGMVTPFELSAAKAGMEEMQTENGYFALLARRGIKKLKIYFFKDVF